MERKKNVEIEKTPLEKKEAAIKKPRRNPLVVEEKEEEVLEEFKEPVVEEIVEKKEEPVVQEEKKELEVDGRILYRKEGGGSTRLLLNGKKTMIKPGQRFKAYPYEIPQAFRDTIVPMNADDVERDGQLRSSTAVKGIKPTYDLRPAKAGLFHVVNQSGKIITDDPIAKSDAEKLIKDLER